MNFHSTYNHLLNKKRLHCNRNLLKTIPSYSYLFHINLMKVPNRLPLCDKTDRNQTRLIVAVSGEINN